MKEFRGFVFGLEIGIVVSWLVSGQSLDMWLRMLLILCTLTAIALLFYEPKKGRV